ncbi:HIT domain-containing protein [candidate division WWE3 bacterium]|nr:HIT domain-containing protein [candidate division WWE3 bacterium]
MKKDDTNKKHAYSEEAQKNARKSHWYSDIASSVTKCPFCDLKEKYIIAESGDVVLTMNLFPYIDGHLMVIPKKHIERLEDFSPQDWRDAHKMISLGMEVIRQGCDVKDVNVLYREGTKKSGSSLKHLHIHLLPITPEFMVYENFRFSYNFCDIEVAPVEMAKRLRSVAAEIPFAKKACR